MAEKKERPDKWDIGSALGSLKRNGVRIDKSKGILCSDVGIRLQGAVDYLVNYCDFHRKLGRK